MIINNIESIDRDVLGKYFANPSDESQKLFKVFCGQLNLKDLEIDEALRELLYYFSLPGESQQIDRIVTVFSEEYCLQNPTKAMRKQRLPRRLCTDYASDGCSQSKCSEEDGLDNFLRNCCSYQNQRKDTTRAD
jgi:Sec7-like guanine-nucleotide exchange factor